jgi:hypothetical protein
MVRKGVQLSCACTLGDRKRSRLSCYAPESGELTRKAVPGSMELISVRPWPPVPRNTIRKLLQLGNRLLDHARPDYRTPGPHAIGGKRPGLGLYRISANSGTYRKVHEAIAREIPAWNAEFWSIFWHPALENSVGRCSPNFRAIGCYRAGHRSPRSIVSGFPSYVQ